MTRHWKNSLKGATGSPLGTHGKWWWWQRFAWLWPTRTNVSLPWTVTTTGSGQPCQISQRSQQTPLLPPCYWLASVLLPWPGWIRGVVAAQIFQSTILMKQAASAAVQGPPSLLVWPWLLSEHIFLQPPKIISYHKLSHSGNCSFAPSTRKQIYQLWTSNNYWLSILAFVIPSFCCSDSQFLVMSACSCPVFCHHHFPDVKGGHNLHRACLNFIFKTDLGWTPASSVTSCWPLTITKTLLKKKQSTIQRIDLWTREVWIRFI